MTDARDRAELVAQLTLLATPGLPQSVALRLLEKYGSARAACTRLHAVCGAGVASAARSRRVQDRVQDALRVIDSDHIHVIAHGDALYPELVRLRLGAHAPPVLFARGALELLAAPGIAIVGCRKASEYGLDLADQIGGGVARAGGCVVSGLALGIDAAAHAAALEAGGTTIAVLGCGIDIHYPRQNTGLQDRIAREGLLLSELLPGQTPRQHTFPHRNRIIAALSVAVVVVEAGEKSGAVATGNHAANQGVPVYCVPNAIHLPNAQGIFSLIRDGAHTYTGLRDLLEVNGLIRLGDSVPMDLFDESPPANAVHARLWRALEAGPVHADALARAAGVTPTAALVALLELELDGRVRQLAGHRFERRRERMQRA
ncbi:MAG TPA: DNA-processing protein DprA [Longimicrobiales bacterium]|nr:DNA-processing protein DprA [Longimicrobiales bacterium]